MRGVRAQEKRSAHASFYYVRQRMEYIDPPFVRGGESFHQNFAKKWRYTRLLFAGARRAFPCPEVFARKFQKSLPGSLGVRGYAWVCLASAGSFRTPAIFCACFCVRREDSTEWSTQEMPDQIANERDEKHEHNEQHGPSSETEINPKIASDIAYWSKRFGISGQDLHEVIRIHGTHIEKIEKHLKDGDGGQHQKHGESH
jgi:hypothetical protein